jgi:ribosomal protein L21E
VKQISFSFLDASRNINEQLRAEAKQEMEAASTNISSGISFEQAAREMGQNVQVSEQQYKMGNYVHVSRSPVILAAQNLGLGEVGGVIEENGSFYIIKCLENEKLGSRYLPFDRVKDRVVNDYIDSRYKEYVHKRISDAQIVLNEEEYRKFEM